jgi:tetratricopeptide (TPR) repeat protein
LEALDTFNKVLAINPESVEALISKAGVLDVLGKYREAAECCQRAFQQMKPHQAFLLPSLYEQNIVLLLRLKKYRKAQLLLKSAEGHLPQEEYQSLLGGYSHILERLSQNRRQAKIRADKLALEVVPTQVSQ